MTIRSAPVLSLGAALLIATGFIAEAQDTLSDKLAKGRSKPFENTVNLYLGVTKKLGQRKIIGGAPAKFWDNRWQVALLVSWIADTNSAQFCGGSILSEHWVVTAAHCVDGTPENEVHVLTGTADLRTNGRRHNVETIFVHKDYNASSLNNDIALLKINGGLKGGDTITPLTPSEAANLAKPKTNARVSGWGVTEDGAPSSILKQVDVPIVSTVLCNDPVSYNGAITNTMVCAGFATGGKDSCQGDSGGPLTVAAGTPDARRLAGVVSWGEGCADPGKYGVYARISALHGWLTACMANGGANCQAK